MVSIAVTYFGTLVTVGTSTIFSISTVWISMASSASFKIGIASLANLIFSMVSMDVISTYSGTLVTIGTATIFSIISAVWMCGTSSCLIMGTSLMMLSMAVTSTYFGTFVAAGTPTICSTIVPVWMCGTSPILPTA